MLTQQHSKAQSQLIINSPTSLPNTILNDPMPRLTEPKSQHLVGYHAFSQDYKPHQLCLPCNHQLTPSTQSIIDNSVWHPHIIDTLVPTQATTTPTLHATVTPTSPKTRLPQIPCKQYDEFPYEDHYESTTTPFLSMLNISSHSVKTTNTNTILLSSEPQKLCSHMHNAETNLSRQQPKSVSEGEHINQQPVLPFPTVNYGGTSAT